MLQKEPELVGIHLVVGLDVCNYFNTVDFLPMCRFFCALIGVCAGKGVACTWWSCAHVILYSIWLF